MYYSTHRYVHVHYSSDRGSKWDRAAYCRVSVLGVSVPDRTSPRAAPLTHSGKQHFWTWCPCYMSANTAYIQQIYRTIYKHTNHPNTLTSLHGPERHVNMYESNVCMGMIELSNISSMSTGLLTAGAGAVTGTGGGGHSAMCRQGRVVLGLNMS